MAILLQRYAVTMTEKVISSAQVLSFFTTLKRRVEGNPRLVPALVVPFYQDIIDTPHRRLHE